VAFQRCVFNFKRAFRSGVLSANKQARVACSSQMLMMHVCSYSATGRRSGGGRKATENMVLMVMVMQVGDPHFCTLPEV
jgi:hypothetical protein